MDLGKLETGEGVTGILSVRDFCFDPGSIWLDRLVQPDSSVGCYSINTYEIDIYIYIFPLSMPISMNDNC
jgi:hypothetical protein